MNYYVFEDEQTAINAELYIRGLAKYPRTSTDVNGNQRIEAQATTKWAIPIQRLDGKWIIPAVPDDLLGKYPQAVIDYGNFTFPHLIEEPKPSWFELLQV
jgi:hypothetical protein